MKDYKAIWNNLSTTFEHAGHVVGFISDEDEIRSNGKITADFLRSVLQIQATDRVLEIGCGVARIGRELAPYCGEWHGSDISGNMIEHARKRTEGIGNIYLHELPEPDLSIFADGAFDCVYSTIVFMHLDKVEMYNYMVEAYRVLAPGGRVYFDTYNLGAPEGWEEFVKVVTSYPPGQRPGHVSQFSTAQEMAIYMEHARYADAHIDDANPQLVVALGRKPEDAGFQRPANVLKSDRTGDRDSTVTGLDLRGLVSSGGEDVPYAEQLVVNGYVVAKDDYVRKLESAIAEKNEHIARIEARLRKQDRLMRTLPVRVALRLSGKRK